MPSQPSLPACQPASQPNDGGLPCQPARHTRPAAYSKRDLLVPASSASCSVPLECTKTSLQLFPRMPCLAATGTQLLGKARCVARESEEGDALRSRLGRLLAADPPPGWQESDAELAALDWFTQVCTAQQPSLRSCCCLIASGHFMHPCLVCQGTLHPSLFSRLHAGRQERG
jgi:hypothetical protein